ncbi:MAG: CPBP family intramembrane metalloprotease [Thermoanaerobaculia bacterium]|nr:CPBP family intramembrane metalloprotease [Thermoanaerobaculia bacterium]
MLELLQPWLPPFLALGAVVAFDRAEGRRGLTPPRFASPVRRGIFLVLLALVLAVGVFGGLAGAAEIDLEALRAPQLFLLHFLFLSTLLFWHALGFGGGFASPGEAWRSLAAQLGLRAPRPGRELLIGLVAGVGGWAGVLVAMLAVGGLVYLVGGPDALPQGPPPVIPWMAAQSVALRLALAVSAGVVEELFFRGFLQPRIGLLASSGLFVLAHLAYDQPLMLVGVALLSLLYGLLVRWRQSLWAAIVAHALFDAIQLLVVIPFALRFLPGAEGAAPAL